MEPFPLQPPFILHIEGNNRLITFHPRQYLSRDGFFKCTQQIFLNLFYRYTDENRSDSEKYRPVAYS